MPYKVSRQPLKERTKSESNQPSIRIVPYSPPRISDGYEDTSSNWAEDCRRSTISASEKTHQLLNSPVGWNRRNIVKISSDSSLSQASATRGKRAVTRRPSTASSSASARRIKKIINVHPDKTFSVLPQSGDNSPLSPYPDTSFCDADTPEIGSHSVSTFGEVTKPLPALPTTSRKRDTSPSSPWNYQFIGGVRKVCPTTPTSAPSAKSIWPPEQLRKPPSSVSLQSSCEGSIYSDETNIRIYKGDTRFSSNKSPISSGDALDQQRSLALPSQTDYERRIKGKEAGDFMRNIPQMDTNYVNLEIRPAFSKESLVVAPLRTSTFKKELQPKHATQENMLRNYLNDSIYKTTKEPASSNSYEFASGALFPDGVEMDPLLHHFWSAPLSTIFSESEEGSERVSRSLSPLSTDLLDTRQYKLGKNSYPLETDEIEPPQAAYYPNGTQHTEGYDRGIEANNIEYDETADVLTELTTLHERQRRSQIIVGASQVLAEEPQHSSSDRWSRNQGLPTWARVYYTSGNNRHLLNKESLESIGTQQRNPVDSSAQHEAQYDTGSTKDEVQTNANNEKKKRVYPEIGWIHTIKKQTSSIWSPHLKPDKRTSGSNRWESPSDMFASAFPTGWRNIQIPLFVCGFILPPAWILAACLPLPPRNGTGSSYYIERKYFASSKAYNDYETAMIAQQAACHSRARWWRSLNRVMAIVGVLITGTYIALIILGVKQPWAS